MAYQWMRASFFFRQIFADLYKEQLPRKHMLPHRGSQQEQSSFLVLHLEIKF